MISRETWVRVIRDFEEFVLPDIIERDLSVDLDLPVKRAVSIIGPRRAGKTYFMFQQMRRLLERGVDRRRILYVNFESDLLFGADASDLRNMIDVFYEIYPESRGKKVYLFLDEIQNVPGWERFVRSIMDSENIQVFISGSSSKLLSREIATALRGRSIAFHIYPFNFREFLRARGFVVGRHLSSSERYRLVSLLNEYMAFGGYPEAVLYPRERGKILREILDVTIYRDIIDRFNVRNAKLVKLLLRQLIVSQYFSVHSFYNYLKSLGYRVSKNTLYNYLEYFADAMVVILLRKYSRSYRESEQTRPKVYFIDNGLLHIGGVRDMGRLLENLVLSEMVKKGLIPNENIFYYSKNGREVDFITLRDGEVESLIQVCYDPRDMETRRREIKSLATAMKDLNAEEGLVITMDYEGGEKIENRKIIYKPLWKWILDL